MEATAIPDRGNRDGVLPPEDVAGIGGPGAEPAAAEDPPNTSVVSEPEPGEVADAGIVSDAGADAGVEREPEPAPGETAVPPEDTCSALEQRVALDLILIIDNSGSMVTTAAELESAVPAFAARLDELAVDYRLILLSGHRAAERGASQDNDASLCIGAPLSGVTTCPSAAPAAAARFFPYAIPIGANNSFNQVLAGFDTPDPFGLTQQGWSEWLREGTQRILIEITDSDSDLPLADFVSGLAAKDPARFTDDVANPGFVFHTVVGMRQKSLELDLYGPDEPVEDQACTGTGSNPANAGPIYQQLSRTTGGLRQSICPASAMNIRLQVLAADIARRSVVACP